jgi:tetratricopeptide (TPR) repeat protein
MADSSHLVSTAHPLSTVRMQLTLSHLRSILPLGIFLLALAATAQETYQLSREQALANLAKPVPDVRRRAAVRLGEIGTVADAEALLKALKDDDADTRSYAEQSIWKVWSHSGNAEIDSLYQQGVAQMVEGSRVRAISSFTTIIERRPEFAEAWNKRATLYLMMGEYEKALRDCGETLKRNPEHFGALANYGYIYVRLAQPDRALEYFRRAFAINPNMMAVAHMIYELDRAVRKRQEREI